MSCCTTRCRGERATRRRRRRSGSISARAPTTRLWYRRQRPRHHGAIFPAPGLRGQPPQPAPAQSLRATLGQRRSVGDHRPRRLQRAGAAGLEVPRPASALGCQREDADPVRHARHPLSDRHAARARRLHAGARLSSLGRRLAQEPAAGRRPAPPGSARARFTGRSADAPAISSSGTRRLPHGAGPNRGSAPRLVQYINMFPADIDEQEEWI